MKRPPRPREGQMSREEIVLNSPYLSRTCLGDVRRSYPSVSLDSYLSKFIAFGVGGRLLCSAAAAWSGAW